MSIYPSTKILEISLHGFKWRNKIQELTFRYLLRHHPRAVKRTEQNAQFRKCAKKKRNSVCEPRFK